jgi:hypothetical protein
MEHLKCSILQRLSESSVIFNCDDRGIIAQRVEEDRVQIAAMFPNSVVSTDDI